jgi:hypothetical protein
MMQDVHVQFNPGLPWQRQLSTKKQIGLNRLKPSGNFA